MSNRQLHNLTPISNSIDSADLFVVVDKSELTTHAVPLRDLSGALDGTIFLSSSYALTSSISLNERVAPGLIGSVSYSFPGSYILTGLTIGKEYSWIKGVNDTSLVNVLQTLTDSGRFTAGAVNVALTGTSLAAVTAQVYEYPRSGVEISQYVITSSYTHTLSGSSAFAWSSSYAFSASQCFTNFDLFEITASDDTLNIYTIPNAGGSITVKPRSPFANSYVLKPTSHADIIGSRIISSTSGVISYLGLPARTYEFEVSKLDSSEKVLKFSATITYNNPPTIRYGEFVYHSAGAQYASGSGVTSISSSFNLNASHSVSFGNVTIASSSIFALNSSGSGTFSISSSINTSSSLYAEHSSLSLTSSNGPLPGMILLYAGIRDSGSNSWYDCNGGEYSTAYVALSSSVGNKFTDGVVSARLPKISSNFYSGSGPYNKQVYLTSTVLGHPTNTQISMSYGTGTIVGTYPEGTVNGTDIAAGGRAFYYNIKR